jgi:hypothetical protein
LGLQFDLETANWMAFVVDHRLPIPSTLESSVQRDRLLAFFDHFQERFYSTPDREAELREAVHRARSRLIESTDPKAIADAIEEIRYHFQRRHWTALILPSGDDPELDEYLCSSAFLRMLLDQIQASGLILQLAEPPGRRLVLEQIFPAMQFALADSSAWPGLLVWNSREEGAFFPFGRRDHASIDERARWIIQKTSDERMLRHRSILEIADLYLVAFPDLKPKGAQLHILQISDLHLGSPEASTRLPRVEQHIERLTRELGNGTVVPVVTGDLMDSPTDRNLDDARRFLRSLSDLGTAAPLVVLGNHDVRKDGWLRRTLGRALQIPTTHGVHWYDEAQVGIACFNSVVDGRLARGYIGERQWIDISNALDAGGDRSSFAVVGVLHHHPIPVAVPDWITRSFYERLMPSAFEATTILEDAASFVQRVEAIPMATVLHGHEHIPAIGETPHLGIPVFGCGSSVGKIKTRNAHETCISINVVSIDVERQYVTGRVLAERIVGAGLSAIDRHGMVYRRRANWISRAIA